VGGFYLVTATERAARSSDVQSIMDRSFERQGLAPADRIEFHGHVLQMFRKRGAAGGASCAGHRRPQPIHSGLRDFVNRRQDRYLGTGAFALYGRPTMKRPVYLAAIASS